MAIFSQKKYEYIPHISVRYVLIVESINNEKISAMEEIAKLHPSIPNPSYHIIHPFADIIDTYPESWILILLLYMYFVAIIYFLN